MHPVIMQIMDLINCWWKKKSYCLRLVINFCLFLQELPEIKKSARPYEPQRSSAAILICPILCQLHLLPIAVIHTKYLRAHSVITAPSSSQLAQDQAPKTELPKDTQLVSLTFWLPLLASEYAWFHLHTLPSLPTFGSSLLQLQCINHPLFHSKYVP